jgi:hypothetical protein
MTSTDRDHAEQVGITVQRYYGLGYGWADVSECWHDLPAAEACLARWQRDFPERTYRLASPAWGDE